jgi:hypothetical protein
MRHRQDLEEQGEAMTRQLRPTNSPAFEVTVALAASTSEKALAELAQQFDGHSNQITQGCS